MPPAFSCAPALRPTLGSYFQWGRNDDVTATATTSAKAAAGTLAGDHSYSSAVYSNQGTYGHYWASSPTGTNGHSVLLSATRVIVAVNSFRAYGFSVRCIKGSAHETEKIVR